MSRYSWLGGQVSAWWGRSLKAQRLASANQPFVCSDSNHRAFQTVDSAATNRSHHTERYLRQVDRKRAAVPRATYPQGCGDLARCTCFKRHHSLCGAQPVYYFHETMQSWSNAANSTVKACPSPPSAAFDRQWLCGCPFHKLSGDCDPCALFKSGLLDSLCTLKPCPCTVGQRA